MNFFIITFDRQPGASYKQFHEAFVKRPVIRLWWHYIKSCYIVGSDLSAGEVSAHFVEVAKSVGIETTHLVLKVDLKDRQGMLPKEAWPWIKKHGGSRLK